MAESIDKPTNTNDAEASELGNEDEVEGYSTQPAFSPIMPPVGGTDPVSTGGPLPPTYVKPEETTFDVMPMPGSTIDKEPIDLG